MSDGDAARATGIQKSLHALLPWQVHHTAQHRLGFCDARACPWRLPCSKLYLLAIRRNQHVRRGAAGDRELADAVPALVGVPLRVQRRRAAGLAHGALPERLVTVDASSNVAGGVDYAFRSTTLERGVALSYTKGAAVKVVFEIQQGLIDRGADLSEISQYPHEREILFGPLSAITTLGTRVEGALSHEPMLMM